MTTYHRWHLRLSVLDDRLAICRLPADEPVPAWARRGTLTSITITEGELSIAVLAEAGHRIEAGQELS